MFSALWIKQWTQLRAFRWAGFGACLALPFFLWAGAAAARRGWLPFSLGSFSLHTLFGEAQPVFAVGLWLLLGVLFAAQTFAGDRADGTDRFLAARPVPPRTIWLARLAASATSLLLVIAASAAYNLALATLVQDGTRAGVQVAMIRTMAFGVGLALLGLLGGVVAGEMLRTPMQAFGVGLVLTALTISLPIILESVFPLARFGSWHLASLLALPFPAVLLFASYRAGCVGEPAGRGRFARGATIIGVVSILTPLLFAAATPLALRHSVASTRPFHSTNLSSRIVLLGGEYNRFGGWIVDAKERRKIRFFAPPVQVAEWSRDGAMLALVHRPGPLGSVGPRRIELFDRSGESMRRFALDDELVAQLLWDGDRLLVTEQISLLEARIRVFDLDRGLLGEIPVAGRLGRRSLLGPTEDGSVYVHSLIGRDPRIYVLQRIDLDALALEPPILTEDGDIPSFSERTLSPSGRYWTRTLFDSEKKAWNSWVVDLTSLLRTDYPESYIVGWLKGGRLVRIENGAGGANLLIHDRELSIVRTRRFDGPVAVAVSPDRARMLVSLGSRRSTPWYPPGRAMLSGADVDQLWIGDGARWTELESLRDGLAGDVRYLDWAGPETLIAYGERTPQVAPATAGASWTPITGGD